MVFANTWGSWPHVPGPLSHDDRSRWQSNTTLSFSMADRKNGQVNLLYKDRWLQQSGPDVYHDLGPDSDPSKSHAPGGWGACSIGGRCTLGRNSIQGTLDPTEPCLLKFMAYKIEKGASDGKNHGYVTIYYDDDSDLRDFGPQGRDFVTQGTLFI